jgi:hypothetical protein
MLKFPANEACSFSNTYSDGNDANCTCNASTTASFASKLLTDKDALMVLQHAVVTDACFDNTFDSVINTPDTPSVAQYTLYEVAGSNPDRTILAIPVEVDTEERCNSTAFTVNGASVNAPQYTIALFSLSITTSTTMACFGALVDRVAFSTKTSGATGSSVGIGVGAGDGTEDGFEEGAVLGHALGNADG